MEWLHEKLKVHQRAMEFADRIYRFADALPKREGVLADQFKHAAMSMTLISVEDHGVWHPEERKEFFVTTRGSAFECAPLLDLCRERNLIDEGHFMTLKGDLEILARLLSAQIKGMGEKIEPVEQ